MAQGGGNQKKSPSNKGLSIKKTSQKHVKRGSSKVVMNGPSTQQRKNAPKKQVHHIYRDAEKTKSIHKKALGLIAAKTVKNEGKFQHLTDLTERAKVVQTHLDAKTVKKRKTPEQVMQSSLRKAQAKLD